MPFDAVFLSAVRQELEQKLIGAKVDKVQMPARDTVILQLRTHSGTERLLLSANCSRPRVHLTRAVMENPASPPMFCMLLRKHLSGGRIAALSQLPMERSLEITLDCTDEMGEPSRKRLILELMGRNSNLIFVGADDRILDCVRRVDLAMSERRQVLPGLYYQQPPQQEKRNPLKTDEATIFALLSCVRSPKRFDSFLQENFVGLSPLICRELSYDLFSTVELDLMTLTEEERTRAAGRLFTAFCALTEKPVPTLLTRNGEPSDFTYRPIRQYGSYLAQVELESFSQLLDRFYAEREHAESMRQKGQTLRRAVTNLRDRAARKLAVQRKELTATYDRERLRRLGDIVTANLYAIARGQTRLTAVDFYDPEMRTIEIPLSPQLSPQQNAARFYKDYAKAKHAEKILTEQIAQGETELSYFESILDELNRAETEKDLAEIRAELSDGGYIRDREQKKKIKTAPQKPMQFRSSDGYTIYVGRNNRQNDLLTTKLAQRGDLWLHAQKIHGSHVIIETNGTMPPDSTVTEAMELAAYFSQARQGQGVPVDYCPVRNVKKPNGAKPGMVVYERYSTGYVTPEKEKVEALRG